MSSEPSSGDPPVFEDEADLTYTIDVIAGLAGVDPPTVLHYQEQGWLRPARVPLEGDAPAGFDAESLRQLRRIEYLRAIGRGQQHQTQTQWSDTVAASVSWHRVPTHHTHSDKGYRCTDHVPRGNPFT